MGELGSDCFMSMGFPYPYLKGYENILEFYRDGGCITLSMY